MRYFQKFPTINYQSTEIQNGLPYSVIRNVPNMLMRLQSTVELGGYEWYKIEDRDRADLLAAKWYGDSQYSWVILLVNNMRDLYDWPMTNLEFHDYMIKKYSNYIISNVSIANSGNNYAINDIVIINGDAEISATLKITDVDAGTVTAVEIVDRGLYNNTNLPITQNNSVLTSTGNGTGLTINIQLITGINAAQLLVHQYLWKNLQTTQELVVDAVLYATLPIQEKRIISIYDYEFMLNDQHRDIKRLFPNTFQKLLRQFEQLMSGV